MCKEVEALDVWFGYGFTSQINGPQHPEPPEVWQTALHHLLNTYGPTYCFLRTGDADTGLVDKVKVEIEQQGNYIGLWNDKQDVFSLIR